jgi:hypothetical protein
VSPAWDRYRAPVWLALSMVGVFAIPYIVWVNRSKPTIVGFDAFATWVLDLGNLYGTRYMDLGSFRYTPAYAQVFSWVGALPWEVFGLLWIGSMAAILAYWGRTSALALLAFPPIALELYHGNIHILMVAAMVVGFRYPAFWAFPLLSKVTPGLAVVWFLGRRDWRSLSIALGTTGAIAAISFLIAPNQWSEWFHTMVDSFTTFVPPRPYPIPIPFLVRAPIGLALAFWGGYTNRRWTVPVAAVLLLPIVWVHGLAMLVALIPLIRMDRNDRPVEGTPLRSST